MAEQVQPSSQAARGGHRGAPFRIVKPGQGIHVRWGTAAGAGVLALSGAHFLWKKMDPILRLSGVPDQWAEVVRTLVPVIALVAMAYLIYRVVGRKQGVVDFLIATEGEMKKVNWSTRREVWGATRVVIVTVIALAVLLFLVNTFFMFLFGVMGVLKGVNLFSMFRGGTSGT
jgi:preprotein translocase SecE subunit